jgi:hypothetical protein
VVEVNGGFGTPKPLLQLLAADQFAGGLQQYGEQLEGLALYSDPGARPAQLTGLQVCLEEAELKHPGDFLLNFRLYRGSRHIRETVYAHRREL